MNATAEVSFKVTKSERSKIVAIARRAVSMAEAAGFSYPMLDAEMDITATHANGCHLDLDRLAAADNFNFAHDIYGIRRHLDRETGKLTNCFVPRCHLSRAYA
jgi:hypothetical protein